MSAIRTMCPYCIPTLEALQGQVGLLNAAEALEKRAERIQAPLSSTAPAFEGHEQENPTW